jgi:hypothetical protein
MACEECRKKREAVMAKLREMHADLLRRVLPPTRKETQDETVEKKT